MLCILFRKISVFRRNAPIDTKRFIQDRDTTICLRVIEVITLILKYSSFRQHSKAMSKTLRNKELTMIIFCQFHSHMLTVCRRTLADIHGNIQHSTLHTSHQPLWRTPLHCVSRRLSHRPIRIRFSNSFSKNLSFHTPLINE